MKPLPPKLVLGKSVGVLSMDSLVSVVSVIGFGALFIAACTSPGDEVGGASEKEDVQAIGGAAADASAQWLWGEGEPQANQVLWFERTFELPFQAAGVTLECGADNIMDVELDGEIIAASQAWETPVRQVIETNSPKLNLFGPGRHHLRVRVENGGGPAGLWLDLTMHSDGDEPLRILTDESWRLFPEQHDAGAQGKPVLVLGPLGIEPWGSPAKWSSGLRPEVLDPESISVPAGFQVERIYTVPRQRQGSWVSMTFDPRGRLVASDQYGGLWRLTPGIQGAAPGVESMQLDLGGAHGLCFVGEVLYAVVDHSGGFVGGLYRVRDTDGDGNLDEVELIRPFDGSGEHGPHAVVPTRDGKGLWVIAGNHTPLPGFVEESRVPRNWGEDQLMPSIEDPNGHANGRLAPAGWLARCDLDGGNWELWATGMRNAYDMVERADGEIFTFDSDMEWDVGLPWYRPTRILHLVPGSDFGWRTGSGKWPAWVPDSLGSVIDLGKASPTGVALGDASSFPGLWQETIFAADWAYGTIHAVHLKERGASFGARSQVFVRGAPLPVTDISFGPDGALWFLVGGRRSQSGVYRVSVVDAREAVASLPTGVTSTAKANPSRKLRQRLEMRTAESGQRVLIGERLQAFASPDPFLRHAARVHETTGGAEWGGYDPDPDGDRFTTLGAMKRWLRTAADRAPLGLDLWSVEERLLSIARGGAPELAEDVHRVLNSVDLLALERDQDLAFLRVRELAFVRMPLPSSGLLEACQNTLTRRFPGHDRTLNFQRAKLLVFLCSDALEPGVLMTENGVVGTVLSLFEEVPSQEDAIEWLYLLRQVKRGWTPELTERLWASFEVQVRAWRGGHSVRRYLDRIAADLELVAPRAEGPWEGQASDSAPGITAPFVHDWTFEELAALVEASSFDVEDATVLELGRQAFVKSSCATCHRFGDVGINAAGAGLGPDLTSVSRRYSNLDLLRSTVLPSDAIAEQYRDEELWTTDGELFLGRVSERTDKEVTIQLAPPEEGSLVIPVGEVEEIKLSDLSRMPEGLLSVLTEEEVLALITFLRSGLLQLEQSEDATK
ncbi:MAG: putative heme-binding domain-containing protein [Planctomycetota bacterium]|jgi:putative heme-binding domain-containing protein